MRSLDRNRYGDGDPQPVGRGQLRPLGVVAVKEHGPHRLTQQRRVVGEAGLLCQRPWSVAICRAQASSVTCHWPARQGPRSASTSTACRPTGRVSQTAASAACSTSAGCTDSRSSVPVVSRSWRRGRWRQLGGRLLPLGDVTPVASMAGCAARRRGSGCALLERPDAAVAVAQAQGGLSRSTGSRRGGRAAAILSVAASRCMRSRSRLSAWADSRGAWSSTGSRTRSRARARGGSAR